MTRIEFAVCLTLFLPTVAAADPGSRHDVMMDRHELRDDLRDAQRAQDLLREFDAAARRGRALDVIEERVWQALRAEADEAAREKEQAAREYGHSQREVRQEQREVAWDARRGDRRESQEDRRDLRDDRRDRADDRRDLIEQAEYRRRITELSNEWARLKGLRRPAWMQRKHDLLVELVDLSRREIRADTSEMREDREERREDRHERREDHR